MIPSVRAEASAKVNLLLRVLSREESGFHSLETVFCAVSLADTLEFERGGPGVELEVEGEVDTGPPERNLVTRAANAFHARLGIAPAVRVLLRKRIPSAAGLGGGSSDAASTLLALDAMHGHPIGRAGLLEIGSSLGSDVPFFLGGSPLALAWGRGERMLRLPPLPSRPVLIGIPEGGIPTAEAFDRLSARRGAGAPVPRVVEIADLTEWERIGELATNDFSAVAEEMLPAVGAIRAAMQRDGARVSLLAGSGSSVFGIFESAAARDLAGTRLEAAGYSTFRARTLESLPPLQVDPREGSV